jgi:hypothetical protein
MTRAFVTALSLFAGTAASVLAQPQPPAVAEPPARTLKGHPNQPLGHAEAGGKTSSTITMIQNAGENTTKVTIVDGEVTIAEHNGKPVPKDRIRQRDGTVEFLDDKGNVEHTMKLNIGFAGRGAPRVWDAPRGGVQNGNPLRVERGGRNGPGQLKLTMPRGELPKVMLGVTMTNADEATLKRLGVEHQEGVFIDSVIEDLPAAKGGLLANDLIVEADGKAPQTEEALRGLLREKKPGDEIKLKVLRKGEAQNITIKLEAYEADKLGRMVPGEGNVFIEGLPEGENWAQEFPGGFFSMKIDQEQVKAAIEEAMKHLKENSKDFEKIKAGAMVELEKALAEIDAHKDEFKGFADIFTERMGNAAPRLRIFNDQGMVAPAPAAPAAGGQLDRLAEQLERLNSRLEELEKRLSEKK